MGGRSIRDPVEPSLSGSDRRRFVIGALAGVLMAPAGSVLRTAGSAAHDATLAGAGAPGPTDTKGRQEMAATSEHYALADGDAEAIWFIGCLALIKGADGRTGGALATVEFLHPAGFATPLHVHHAADEAFYVLEGAMRGVCGDREWRATTGAFVWLPRGVPHGYAVDGDVPLRTLVITLPAGFDRFVAEAGEPARMRALPPPAPPDIDKLVAVGIKYGIENVGPPVTFDGIPTP